MSKTENIVSFVDISINVEFEGVNIALKQTNWVSQPNRDSPLFVKIYCEKIELPATDPVHKFIEKRFLESDLFKKVKEDYKLK